MKQFEDVCVVIEQGNTLSQACKKVGVNCATFRDWLSSHDLPLDVALRYARARDNMLEAYADQLVQFSMDDSRDGTNSAAAQRDRLRFDAIKWLLSKMKPEKYGELLRIDQNIRIAKVAETPIEIEDAKVEWVKEHHS